MAPTEAEGDITPALPDPAASHPPGLFYLAATEAFNAFALYGMISLLVLYLVSQALLPGQVENIVGFEGFRTALEAVFGPLSTIALASQIFGLLASSASRRCSAAFSPIVCWASAAR